MSVPRQRVERRPTPPSAYIREYILEEYGLTQERLAKSLGVSRLTVNQLANDKRAITADTAVRLGIFTGTTPEFWLNLQRAVDIWDAQREFNEKKVKVARLDSAARTEI